MDKYLEGLEGEKIIRDYFINKKIHFFQVDLMAKLKNKWNVIEVKHQEPFEPPPFKGHGLPKWQIDARLQFQNETGIRALLFIRDKITEIIYWQYMDKLMEGNKFQTNGMKPRIIFPIENYNILEL
jgi:hypothetical protein